MEGKKGLNSGQILKVDLTGLAGQLTVGMRKREESRTSMRLLD